MKNIHKREEPTDYEKCSLEFQESLGQMSSKKQDFQKLCPTCATTNVLLHDEKSGQLFASHFLPKSRNIGNNSHTKMEEDSRISMKQSLHFPTRSLERRRTPETIGRFVSWLATITFSLCLLSITLSKPLLQPQGPRSLWLAIIGMFNFTLFLSASSVMLVAGACFTQMQITFLLISFMALFLA